MGFTGNFTIVPTGRWVTWFFLKLVVDSDYSRSTPFVQAHNYFSKLISSLMSILTCFLFTHHQHNTQ
ncbi:hypothetical protein HanIR_Chr03g0115221 [Helianthus annuus]|nr:hypothetical protein HanIR_Chr03g0115221 [Helianthus annuus]